MSWGRKLAAELNTKQQDKARTEAMEQQQPHLKLLAYLADHDVPADQPIASIMEQLPGTDNSIEAEFASQWQSYQSLVFQGYMALYPNAIDERWRFNDKLNKKITFTNLFSTPLWRSVPRQETARAMQSGALNLLCIQSDPFARRPPRSMRAIADPTQRAVAHASFLQRNPYTPMHTPKQADVNYTRDVFTFRERPTGSTNKAIVLIDKYVKQALKVYNQRILRTHEPERMTTLRGVQSVLQTKRDGVSKFPHAAISPVEPSSAIAQALSGYSRRWLSSCLDMSIEEVARFADDSISELTSSIVSDEEQLRSIDHRVYIERVERAQTAVVSYECAAVLHDVLHDIDDYVDNGDVIQRIKTCVEKALHTRSEVNTAKDNANETRVALMTTTVAVDCGRYILSCLHMVRNMINSIRRDTSGVEYDDDDVHWRGSLRKIMQLRTPECPSVDEFRKIDSRARRLATQAGADVVRRFERMYDSLLSLVERQLAKLRATQGTGSGVLTMQCTPVESKTNEGINEFVISDALHQEFLDEVRHLVEYVQKVRVQQSRADVGWGEELAVMYDIIDTPTATHAKRYMASIVLLTGLLIWLWMFN